MKCFQVEFDHKPVGHVATESELQGICLGPTKRDRSGFGVMAKQHSEGETCLGGRYDRPRASMSTSDFRSYVKSQAKTLLGLFKRSAREWLKQTINVLSQNRFASIW